MDHSVVMTHTQPVSRKGPFARFRTNIERDGISAWTASFKDKDIEAAYIDNLVKTTLPNERLIWATVITAYFLFGILDLLTISDHLTHILSTRFATGMLIVALVPLSYVNAIKPYFGWLSAAAIFISAQTIIYIIAIMPADDPPPYIIGVLVVFIATSCILRIPFRVAASVYIFSSLSYLAVLNMVEKFSHVDIISGHFFMISIALVAVLTIYTQEIRSRMIWHRDERHKSDAAMIEKLLIEATAADRSKINFLSMMSHELRTPLHQIIGFTEIAKTTFSSANDDEESAVAAPEPGHGPHDQILSAAHMLLSRIQKMLRYADATAGKIEYDIAATSISELVEASLEQMLKSFEKKGIRVDASELEEAKVCVDIFHTCYAINNILENARDASKINGRLWISGRLEPDGSYLLIIRDEGAGMSPEQLDSVLTPFAQGENVLSRSHEGLGLGLTLANRVFTDQNAELGIHSELNVGTTVTVRFRNDSADQTRASEQKR